MHRAVPFITHLRSFMRAVVSISHCNSIVAAGSTLTVTDVVSPAPRAVCIVPPRMGAGLAQGRQGGGHRLRPGLASLGPLPRARRCRQEGSRCMNARDT